MLESGRCCILDIDVQGARQVRATDLPALFVFVAPPSLSELERRLRARGTEREDQVASRLATARTELESVHETGLYDVVLTNDDLDETAAALAAAGRRAIAGDDGAVDGEAGVSTHAAVRVWRGGVLGGGGCGGV